VLLAILMRISDTTAQRLGEVPEKLSRKERRALAHAAPTQAMQAQP
jgi:hypothetical protein